MTPINKAGTSPAAQKPFEAPQTLPAPAEAAEKIANKEIEVRKLNPGETMLGVWSSAGKQRGQSWADFQTLNRHIFEHPKTDGGNHVRPGFEVLLPAPKPPGVAPPAVAPGWAHGQAGAGRGLVNPPLVGAKPPEEAAKPDPAVGAAAEKLRQSGYEPTEANLKPAALAAELVKRSAGRTNMDYEFINSALGYAHASGSVAELNEAVGKDVAAKAVTETLEFDPLSGGVGLPFHELAKAAEATAGPKKDNFLRAIIGLKTTESARKTAEDYLTTGKDQHRATTMEKLTEQAVRWGKDVGQSVADNPVKALAIAGGTAAVIVAAPFAIAAAAGWAAASLGLGAAAAASTVGSTVAGVTGLAAVGAVAYGAHRVVTAGEKLIDSHGKTGADRDAALEGTVGDAIEGAMFIGGGRAFAPERVAVAGPPGTPGLLPPPPPPAPVPARIGGPGGSPPPAAVAGEPLQLTYQPAQPLVPIVPKAAEPVAAPRSAAPAPAEPITVSGTFSYRQTLDANHKGVTVYEPGTNVSFGDAVKTAQTAAMRKNGAVWLKGTDANKSFPNHLVGVELDGTLHISPVRGVTLPEAAGAPSLAERALQLFEATGQDVSIGGLRFNGDRTVGGLPIARYALQGGHAPKMLTNIKAAAETNGAKVDYSGIVDGHKFSAFATPDGAVRVNFVPVEAAPVTADTLRSLSRQAGFRLEFESPFSSNRFEPFAMENGQALPMNLPGSSSASVLPTELRSATEAARNVADELQKSLYRSGESFTGPVQESLNLSKTLEKLKLGVQTGNVEGFLSRLHQADPKVCEEIVNYLNRDGYSARAVFKTRFKKLEEVGSQEADLALADEILRQIRSAR